MPKIWISYGELVDDLIGRLYRTHLGEIQDDCSFAYTYECLVIDILQVIMRVNASVSCSAFLMLNCVSRDTLGKESECDVVATGIWQRL